MFSSTHMEVSGSCHSKIIVAKEPKSQSDSATEVR